MTFDDWMELRGRGAPYRRLIVVCGMARTGTSALAAYLASHPDVKVVVGGPMWHRLESDYVRTGVNWDFIDGVLKEFWPKRILLKQPWLEKNEDFFERARGAKVLVCTRSPDTLFASWQQSPLAGMEVRKHPWETYGFGMLCCLRLRMDGAMVVRQERMTPELAKPLGKFLGIRIDRFDEARIKDKWTGVKDLEWIKSIAVWRDRK